MAEKSNKDKINKVLKDDLSGINSDKLKRIQDKAMISRTIPTELRTNQQTTSQSNTSVNSTSDSDNQDK